MTTRTRHCAAGDLTQVYASTGHFLGSVTEDGAVYDAIGRLRDSDDFAAFVTAVTTDPELLADAVADLIADDQRHEDWALARAESRAGA